MISQSFLKKIDKFDKFKCISLIIMISNKVNGHQVLKTTSNLDFKYKS